MPQSVEQRIECVIQNLRAATAFSGNFSSPKTLYERLVDHHTPGISIAVINDFEIDWARGFGMCESGTAREVTPDTLFQAGSISKPVFALAVMRLVQEDRLDLDEDVNAYLTAWRVPANGNWQPRVTLRHLLSHTAGTTVQGFYGYDASATLPTTVQILNGEFPANSKKVEVSIIPGLHYRYSGGGMVIGQQVLVDTLHKSFPDIMRELVFEPLGMTHSTYQQPLPPELGVMAATAHPINGTPIGGKYMNYPELAAAGLWTTPTDLAKLGIELMGVLHDRPPTIWNKETITEMLRPQTEQSEGLNGLLLGLGFAGRGEGDNSYFFHGGTNIGFVAEMRFYKSTGQGAIVMLNSNEGEALRDEVMRAIGQEYNWADIFPPDKTVITLSQTRRYLGWYATTSGLQFQITRRDGNLFLHCGQQPPIQLSPTSELEFFARAVNVDISFEENSTDSRITAMRLSQADVMTLGLMDKQIRAEKMD